LRAGNNVVMKAEVRATPLEPLAIGGMVAAILLSIRPIVHASRTREALPPRH